MTDTKIIIGGSAEEDAAAFLDAWHRAERGEVVDENVLAFESWEALAAIMTGERFRLLRHIHPTRRRRSRPWLGRWGASTGACMPMWPRWRKPASSIALRGASGPRLTG